jgi:hypothetical protein
MCEAEHVCVLVCQWKGAVARARRGGWACGHHTPCVPPPLPATAAPSRAKPPVRRPSATAAVVT